MKQLQQRSIDSDYREYSLNSSYEQPNVSLVITSSSPISFDDQRNAEDMESEFEKFISIQRSQYNTDIRKLPQISPQSLRKSDIQTHNIHTNRYTLLTDPIQPSLVQLKEIRDERAIVERHAKKAIDDAIKSLELDELDKVQKVDDDLIRSYYFNQLKHTYFGRHVSQLQRDLNELKSEYRNISDKVYSMLSIKRKNETLENKVKDLEAIIKKNDSILKDCGDKVRESQEESFDYKIIDEKNKLYEDLLQLTQDYDNVKNQLTSLRSNDHSSHLYSANQLNLTDHILFRNYWLMLIQSSKIYFDTSIDQIMTENELLTTLSRIFGEYHSSINSIPFKCKSICTYTKLHFLQKHGSIKIANEKCYSILLTISQLYPNRLILKIYGEMLNIIDSTNYSIRLALLIFHLLYLLFPDNQELLRALNHDDYFIETNKFELIFNEIFPIKPKYFAIDRISLTDNIRKQFYDTIKLMEQDDHEIPFHKFLYCCISIFKQQNRYNFDRLKSLTTNFDFSRPIQLTDLVNFLKNLSPQYPAHVNLYSNLKQIFPNLLNDVVDVDNFILLLLEYGFEPIHNNTKYVVQFKNIKNSNSGFNDLISFYDII